MNFGRLPALALILWTLPSLATAADLFTARVVRVKDGDTVVVLQGKKQIDVRLEDIDCPESGQSFGQKAKQAVSKVAFGKTVTIQPSGTDRYPPRYRVTELPSEEDWAMLGKASK
jgi:endonuclease YncB( thermonuclease family)